MPKTDQSSVSALADALTIDAFDQFRNVSRRAGLPLAITNAFAAYKTAVDFALLATNAQADGNPDEVKKLVGWAFSALADMGVELSRLLDCGGATADYPAH